MSVAKSTNHERTNHMTQPFVKAPSVGAQIRNAIKRFKAAKATVADDAGRESANANKAAVRLPSDDGQDDSAIAVRKPRELERWLRAAEARPVATSRPSLAARFRSWRSGLFGG
jgi:hypothetical protein